MIVLILALWILTTYWLLTELEEASGRFRTDLSPRDHDPHQECEATCQPSPSGSSTSPASSSPSSS